MPPGRWIDVRAGWAVAFPDVVRRAVASRIVLLGEDHDRASHHRWQAYVAAALAGAAPHVVLGFEMFPRRVQPALDRWVAGIVDEPAFLAESQWEQVWGFPPALYRPLFELARTFRIPMRALNVDRTLVRRLAREGWDAVPTAERDRLSPPAPASDAYRDRLRAAWQAHPHDPADDPAAFDRFVAAQLVWDRAMATALADALATRRDGVVVAIVGRGHVERGAGIPAQLAALGAPAPLVLVPWDAERPCSELAPDVADLVFGLAPEAPATADDHS